MQKRIKLPEGTVLDWYEDSSEYSSWIWKWWKGKKINSSRSCYRPTTYSLFYNSTLSCNVERLFSQLELIRQRCGENMLDDLAELRVFMRSETGSNLDDLHHALKR